MIKGQGCCAVPAEKWGRFFPFIFPAEHEKMQGKNRPHFSLDQA